MLAEMAMRVMNTRSFEETIEIILDDVIAFYGAQYGTMQLAADDNLVIAAQRGFNPQFLQLFRHVTKDDGRPCGKTLRLRQSTVVADIEKDPDFNSYRNAAKRAGFRSIQCTPFITQDGKLVGIVSVHFAAPGGPTRSDAEAFHLYTNVAADQACVLLGDVTLAAKAAQMSDELYSSFVTA